MFALVQSLDFFLGFDRMPITAFKAANSARAMANVATPYAATPISCVMKL